MGTLYKHIRFGAVCRRVRAMSTGEFGSGSGKGGGDGGSVRGAGGAMGKREAALEEEYFRRKTAEQLKDIKKHHDEQKKDHMDQIALEQEKNQKEPGINEETG